MATASVPRSVRCPRPPETGKTCAVCLITQRSQVQILPPLPGSAGQRPDRQGGGRALIFAAALWQQDLAALAGQE